MEQPTSKPGPEPADRSETSQANPENSPSLSIEELLEKMRMLGWDVSQDEPWAAIFVPVGGGEPGPDEEDQEEDLEEDEEQE